MKKFISLTLMLAFSFVLSVSCSKSFSPIPDEEDENPIIKIPDDTSNDRVFSELVVPRDFTWRTTKEVGIQIHTRNSYGDAIPRAIVKVYTDYPMNGGELMLKGITDTQGEYENNRIIPSHFTHLVLATEHIGLLNYIKVPIQNDAVAYTFDGSGNTNSKSSGIINPSTLKSTLKYLGGFNSHGTPDYLLNPGTNITNGFLADLTSTLTENESVPKKKVELLGEGKEHDLLIDRTSNVYVTFVHEGASFNNALAFYAYDVSNPPKTVNEIGDITVVFPNTSYVSRGGGLKTGDKVRIGNFSANTGIGWVLIAGGWKDGGVTGGTYYYSNKSFNPEGVQSKKQHSLFLLDQARKQLILSFEDLNREDNDSQKCDHDFNDCIYLVETDPDPNPSINLPLLDYSTSATDDTDGDGIPDNFDDYPEDADMAFNNYYPSADSYASLAYEDLWPGLGDYDFNDLVINYNFNQITNHENKITRIDGTLKVMARGADMHNGFGIELPINSSEVKDVTGMSIHHGFITLNANKTEAGHTKAVIIPFDDTYDILPHPGVGTGTNTDPSAPYIAVSTVNIKVILNNPTEYSSMGSPPYNPFLIVNRNREHEVHLPDYEPTALFNMDLLRTVEDHSNAAIGRYFKSDKNYPWAIHVPKPFNYPKEKIDITKAYKKFAAWAESGGITNTDWYEDLDGYRDQTKIYDIPQYD